MVHHHWKDLLVWQKSHQLVLEIYTTTDSFPDDERYNLTGQLRRASTSIAVNIVEGHSRNSKKDFQRFLYISRGSLEELRYLIFLAKDLGYINDDKLSGLESECSEISIMLNKLIKSID